MGDWLDLLAQRQAQLGSLLCEHLMLTYTAMAAAALIGLPVGLWVTRRPAVRGPILALAGVVQTIPSVALLGLLLPLLGIGTRPAIVALALYALLPIIRNTYTGLDGVPAHLIEAADGLGFTGRQRFWLVELPLAMPIIVAGVRTAMVICVGVATLAAFIGAGGLGVFIFLGLQRSHNALILLGAVPAALLALWLDLAIGRVEAHLRLDPTGGRRPAPRRALAWAVLPPLLVLAGGRTLAGRAATPPSSSAAADTITIGSKNFTEQHLIGEMMALLVEHRTPLTVSRRFGLEGTKILHAALVRGDIDLYAEYTGTGLMDVLKLPLATDPKQVYDSVAQAYATRYRLTWLAPFGFDNTYALCVREADAKTRGWSTISDLASAAPRLTAGFTGEFIERNDGYVGLRRLYGFGFGEVRMLDPGLMYRAAAAGSVDVICGFATDGRIGALHLSTLRDDRGLFPPYQCAPVVRADTLRAHPELRSALEALAGRIDDRTMRDLNYEVDGRHRPVAAVARGYLERAGLLPADSDPGE